MTRWKIVIRYRMPDGRHSVQRTVKNRMHAIEIGSYFVRVFGGRWHLFDNFNPGKPVKSGP